MKLLGNGKLTAEFDTEPGLLGVMLEHGLVRFAGGLLRGSLRIERTRRAARRGGPVLEVGECVHSAWL